MKYFVLCDLGYDGLVITSFDTLHQAESYYKQEEEATRKWIKDYGEETADKGIALIEGTILKSKDMEIELGLPPSEKEVKK